MNCSNRLEVLCAGGPRLEEISAFAWFGINLAEVPPSLSDGKMKTLDSVWGIVSLIPAPTKISAAQYSAVQWPIFWERLLSSDRQKEVLSYFPWLGTVIGNSDLSRRSWKRGNWEQLHLFFLPGKQGNYDAFHFSRHETGVSIAWPDF